MKQENKNIEEESPQGNTMFHITGNLYWEYSQNGIAIRLNDGEIHPYIAFYKYQPRDDIEEINIAKSQVEKAKKQERQRIVEELEGMKDDTIFQAIQESEGTIELPKEDVIREDTWNKALNQAINKIKNNE